MLQCINAVHNGKLYNTITNGANSWLSAVKAMKFPFLLTMIRPSIPIFHIIPRLPLLATRPSMSAKVYGLVCFIFAPFFIEHQLVQYAK